MITCDWWDEIWINEAFAEYGTYIALRYSEPDWNPWNEYLRWDLFSALKRVS